MSRNEEFYHGTTHPFTEGDVIEPRRHVAAFATTSEQEAANYANYRASTDGALFGMVYSVEPIGPTKKDIGKVVTSRGGFRVTGLKSWA
jgi:hypothetical protein